MFVCVVPLSQSSCRDLLSVTCLCVLSRYLSPVVEIMFVCVVPLSQPSSRDLLSVTCLCVLSRYLSLVVEICYLLHVCVCCPVISV